MKLQHLAALTFLSLGFQLGQANALGWKECYNQAQCGPKEFCGVSPGTAVGACQPSDSWPLTPATTTDSSTGVYGSSVVQGGCCGTEQGHPSDWTPPDSPPPDWAHLARIRRCLRYDHQSLFEGYSYQPGRRECSVRQNGELPNCVTTWRLSVEE